MNWDKDSVERRDDLFNVFNSLSDEGQKQLLGTACRIYMRERRITEEEILRLGARNPLIEARRRGATLEAIGRDAGYRTFRQKLLERALAGLARRRRSRRRDGRK